MIHFFLENFTSFLPKYILVLEVSGDENTETPLYYQL
jgi:hypothetical protein